MINPSKSSPYSKEYKNIKQKYYLNYLNKSLVGHIYRRVILFPFFSKFFKKNNKVLDYGCGLGFFINFASKKVDVIGCDINEYFVQHCIDSGLNAKLIKKSDYLPFENNYFDSIFMDNVLEHIEDPRTIIHQIHAKLKKDGLFVIGVPGKKGYESDEDHKVYYDEKLLKDQMQKFKFIFYKNYYLPFFVKSEFLNLHSRSYCLYMVFKKS